MRFGAGEGFNSGGLPYHWCAQEYIQCAVLRQNIMTEGIVAIVHTNMYLPGRCTRLPAFVQSPTIPGPLARANASDPKYGDIYAPTNERQFYLYLL